MSLASLYLVSQEETPLCAILLGEEELPSSVDKGPVMRWRQVGRTQNSNPEGRLLGTHSIDVPITHIILNPK